MIVGTVIVGKPREKNRTSHVDHCMLWEAKSLRSLVHTYSSTHPHMHIISHFIDTLIGNKKKKKKLSRKRETSENSNIRYHSHLLLLQCWYWCCGRYWCQCCYCCYIKMFKHDDIIFLFTKLLFCVSSMFVRCLCWLAVPIKYITFLLFSLLFSYRFLTVHFSPKIFVNAFNASFTLQKGSF